MVESPLVHIIIYLIISVSVMMIHQYKQACICPWQLFVFFQHCGSLTEGIALLFLFSGDPVSRKEMLPTCLADLCLAVCALSTTAVLWAFGARHVIVS